MGGAEVEERSVMNMGVTRTTRGRWKLELQTDRQAGGPKSQAQSSAERPGRGSEPSTPVPQLLPLR